MSGVGAVLLSFLGGVLAGVKNRDHSFWIAWCFVLPPMLLFILLWGYSRRARPVGAVSGAFLVGYGAFRSIAEFYREPDDFLGLLALGLSMPSALARYSVLT